MFFKQRLKRQQDDLNDRLFLWQKYSMYAGMMKVKKDLQDTQHTFCNLIRGLLNYLVGDCYCWLNNYLFLDTDFAPLKLSNDFSYLL